MANMLDIIRLLFNFSAEIFIWLNHLLNQISIILHICFCTCFLRNMMNDFFKKKLSHGRC
jgi:hypothetical protein